MSESESNCSEQWYELDGQEQEALISLRDARKKLQHAAKSRRFYSKGGGRARSTGKIHRSVEECGRRAIDVVPSVTGKKFAHSLPEAARRDHPLQRAKEKSRRFRREKSDGKGRGGSMNYPIVEVYNDGSKNQTSHMKVLPGYAVLDCGAAKSLCGAKLVAQMAQTCAREGKRVGPSATLRQSMSVIISEESEIRLSAHL